MKLQRNFPLLVLHIYTLNCTTFLYTKLSLHIQTHYTNKGQQQLMHKEKRTQEESRAALDKNAMLPDCCSKRKEAVM
jgi:outer membrane PBP1 activator LpoA protein